MLALSNPRAESALVRLAAALASHGGGRVLATHIVTVPHQTALATASENRERIDASSEELLAGARRDAETFDVPIETKTILSYRVTNDRGSVRRRDTRVTPPRTRR